MATPEPDDPSAPTHRIEPTATRPDQGGRGRTRWVTQILRPGNGRSEVGDAGDDAHTSVLPAHTRRFGLSNASAGEQPPARPRWRHPTGALLGWFPRLVSRVVVGPAGELDYAIPEELRRSYRVQGHIGSGGEAMVYLAEPVGEPDRQLALKVYRPGHDINRELLDRLRARGATDPYTPAIHGYGTARSSWGEDVAWEAQEYFAAGSLRTLIDQAPLPDERARDIVAAVAACLHHWQDSLQHNHTDVKPENLLIRKADPPVFALTDFGGAVRATMSRVYGSQAVTEDYAAPEVIEGRREAPAAWWSLGVMAHEMMAGRRPVRGENWLTVRNSEVDVSAIPDEEWRLLAQGLLTPVPAARWGYAEVRQWLAGERPEIVKARRYAPISFADVSHDDPPSLAFDLMDRSDKGSVWLRTHWPTLRTWLDREANDYTFDRSYLTVLDDEPERAHVAISALAARFVPGMAPRYRGHEVSAEGVLAMAVGESARHATLREAIELGALGLAARHWCDHPVCRAEGTNRCVLLERVQHEVPLIMRQVRTTVERVLATDARDVAERTPATHEWDRAWAEATELVLDPDAATRKRRHLRAQSWHPAHRSDAPRAEWWRAQRSAALRGPHGDVATNAAISTATMLLPSALRAGAAQRQLDRDQSRGRWRERWHRIAAAVGGGWSRARERLPGGDSRGDNGAQPPPDPDRPPSGTPYRNGSQTQRKQDRERRRVDRGMRQIERAMGSGRCRRFAYPAGLAGLAEGLGRSLLPPEGFFPQSDAVLAGYEVLLAVSDSPPVSALAAGAQSVTGLLPGGSGNSWWFPVVLGLALFVLGRTAAGKQRKARVRLMSYRLSVAGSLLMVVTVLAGGLLTLGSGILIPLDSVLG
ncbi:serine/threonine protein kinase [Lipingzhangella halophila]|uniref:non-specific serine/threonine protein kinase n=1 Tax=Lipingzhangella halophila TaxID=1783352 RepID=A0A7W7RFW0_9ACTN|nr:serine/threonine protein kinase [Lipingzhangella halophila]MBB4930923.1 serine/threonine protein kinase [Lipingzhangella halophila]